MPASLFDLFRIGLGPSSSHTVGPMRAANDFIACLEKDNLLEKTERIQVELYGSLALTGAGHGSLKAVTLGLEGHLPETTDPNAIEGILERIGSRKTVTPRAGKDIAFDPQQDLRLCPEVTHPAHPNALRITAIGAGKTLVYYSIGGGFLERADENGKILLQEGMAADFPVAYENAGRLLEICRSTERSISDIVWENETSLRPKEEVTAALENIRRIMRESIERGLAATDVLPGGLSLPRRAGDLHLNLKKQENSPLLMMDRVSMWAMATAEENAAGGRIVTAPTNGAAGILPAVLRFLEISRPSHASHAAHTYLLTATAIANLFRDNASISGAEVGCQGEIGVACSMAAAGLAAALGATPEQVENAAEIGIEHHLGLTCDPVAGLVQIPCIERNAMGAVKAITAARLSLYGNGSHHISLDDAMETMLQTGADMKNTYKETARGGLAVYCKNC